MFDKCRSRANIIFGEKLSLVPPSFPINSKGSEHISNWLNSVIHTKFHHHYCNSSDTYLNLCGMSLCRKILLCITTRQKGLVNLFFFFYRFVSVTNATFFVSLYWSIFSLLGDLPSNRLTPCMFLKKKFSFSCLADKNWRRKEEQRFKQDSHMPMWSSLFMCVCAKTLSSWLYSLYSMFGWNEKKKNPHNASFQNSTLQRSDV